MAIPSLAEAVRAYAAREISKQRYKQIVNQHQGLCRFCSRKATRGVRCEVCADKQAAQRAAKSTCLACGKVGHYRKNCATVAQ